MRKWRTQKLLKHILSNTSCENLRYKNFNWFLIRNLKSDKKNIILIKNNMIKREQPFFQCEYCRWVYVREKVCAYHEKVCRKNPANKHICIWSANWHECEFLEVEERNDENLSKMFWCKKHRKYMYTYKAERRWDNNWEIRTMQCDNNRMPLECPEYEKKKNPFDWW